jgi:hypothetical protein
LVGYARRNFLVPVPRVESFAALNAGLEARCRERQGARLRGHDETIGERLARDRQVLLALPAAPYDACEVRSARVSSLSLVRYRGNDYSVPVAYGHREALVRGYVEEVVIACGAEVVARHRRPYERVDVLLEPVHYSTSPPAGRTKHGVKERGASSDLYRANLGCRAGPQPACCTELTGSAGGWADVGGCSPLSPDSDLALQAELGPPLPYPSAEAQGHQLGSL